MSLSTVQNSTKRHEHSSLCIGVLIISWRNINIVVVVINLSLWGHRYKALVALFLAIDIMVAAVHLHDEPMGQPGNDLL